MRQRSSLLPPSMREASDGRLAVRPGSMALGYHETMNHFINHGVCRRLCYRGAMLGIVLSPIVATGAAQPRNLPAQAVWTLEHTRAVMATVTSLPARPGTTAALAPQTRVIEIILHRGRRYEEYVHDLMNGQETVQTTTQACTRAQPHAPWTCRPIDNAHPWSFFDQLAARPWTALGIAPCGRHQCRDYRSASLPFDRNERVVIIAHIDARIRRFVELDMHLILSGNLAQLPLLRRPDFAFVFSRWGDRSLRKAVPRVPQLTNAI